MNRRELFGFASSGVLVEKPNPNPAPTNSTSSTKPVPTSGINKYTGPWDRERAAHLLRRTMFGPRKEEIDLAVQLGMDKTIDLLLNNTLWAPTSAPPFIITSKGEISQSLNWENTANTNNNEERTNALKAWWAQQMLHQGISIREKLSLCLHNTLVTSTAGVNDARLTYRYLKLIRDNALGNYKDLIRKIATDPAMLVYLHAKDNVKGSPNEDFARELMELFTLGREDINGNPNYTENDVVEVARCMTGWKLKPLTAQNLLLNDLVTFDNSVHDTNPKQLSSFFWNRVIHRTLPSDYHKELDDVLELIFYRFQTPQFIVKEFYRWFVYSDIDSVVDQNVIIPLADAFIRKDYDIKFLIRTILESKHFNDDLLIGAKIKDPVEFVVGSFRSTSDNTTFLNDTPDYQLYFAFVLQQLAAELQMDILSPPNVAGWSPLYQLPSFAQLWINAFSILKRSEITDIAVKQGITKGNNIANVQVVINNTFRKINIGLFFQTASDVNAHDIDLLIDGLCKHLFPLDATPLQKQRLKDVLLEGMSEEDWTATWTSYFATSQVAQIENQATRKRLENFLAFMMGMAEYHLI
jgi:uncharacterized protein (DUF1800 family)